MVDVPDINKLHVQGSQILDNINVQKYIKERTQSVKGTKIADLIEVKQF